MHDPTKYKIQQKLKSRSRLNTLPLFDTSKPVQNKMHPWFDTISDKY